jgi:hypothetical protein
MLRPRLFETKLVLVETETRQDLSKVVETETIMRVSLIPGSFLILLVCAKYFGVDLFDLYVRWLLKVWPEILRSLRKIYK